LFPNVEPLHEENWMRAQTSERSVPGTQQIREAKLLLVGSEEDFRGGFTGDIMSVKRSYVAGRSTTLLGALARLHSQAIDVVLLSHRFRDDELAMFTADARRSGFQGLLLRVASLDAPASLDYRFPSPRPAPGPHQENEPTSGTISFTDRQRSVLVHVSEGWTNRQIARSMNCTEAAIKAVLQELFRKLQVRKRAQIVRVAIERQLIHIEGPVGGASEITETGGAFTLAPALKDPERIHVGDFIIDAAMHQTWVRGVEAHLTPSEFQLLWVLATHSGKLIKSTTLREMFWRNPTARVGSLRVLVGTLRSKIEATKIPRYLITERSLGYRFIPSPPVSKTNRPPM
jgi:DNA-binding CsgD family transcriptional regulator/DNA-binding winged helix-turn-helix (wHTH) protein